MPHLHRSSGRRFPSLLMACLLFAAASPSPTADAAVPYALTTVRAVHVVPGAPGLNIEIDGSLATSDLRFGHVSDSVTIEPGDHVITVKPTGGAGVAIVEEEVQIDEGSAYIVTVFGQIGETEARINEVNLDALPPGMSRIRLIHVATGAGDLDLHEVGGEEVFDRVAFDRDTSYAELPAGAHALDVRGGKDQATSLAMIDLETGDGLVYDLIVYSDPESGATNVVVILTSASPPCSEIVGIGTPADACLRIVNASGVDAITVDIAGTSATGPLASDVVTGFVAVPAADDLAMTIVGAPVEAREIDLVAGQAYIVVVPAADGQTPVVAEINLTPLPDSQLRLRLINVAEAFGEIDARVPAVDDTILLFSDVGPMSASRYRVLDRGQWQFEIMGDDEQVLAPWLMLESGLVYDVVIRPGASGFELLVVTSPAEIRGAEGTPVAAAPGATPVPADS